MNPLEWINLCIEIKFDLEKMVQFLGAMENEGAQREQEGFENIRTRFISVAKRNMQAQSDSLTSAIKLRNIDGIFNCLRSIKVNYRYFRDEDLSWSTIWNDFDLYRDLYRSILLKAGFLVREAKVKFRQKSFKREIFLYLTHAT